MTNKSIAKKRYNIDQPDARQTTLQSGMLGIYQATIPNASLSSIGSIDSTNLKTAQLSTVATIA